MRILILSQYYYPEPVEKVHDLAKGLVALGHEVEVITGFPSYPNGRTYPGYRQSVFHRENIDGVSVIRLPQYPDHSRSALRRILYYLSFALAACTIGPIVANRADVLLVYLAALPIGLSGWLLSRLKRIPMVLDVVDLWPESVSASGMLSQPRVMSAIRKTAAFVYRRAYQINVVTEGYRHKLLELGVPTGKISVVHNWMPEETYRCTARDSELAKREGLEGRFNVMYAGNMGPSQNLDTVIQAAVRLRDIPQIQFVLVGAGLEHEQLIASAREQRLQNVRFLGRQPPERMASFYALSDVLLVHLKPDALSEISIPSKTFAYLASGRPILMAVRGDAESFIKENRCGLAVAPADPEKMAEAVRWFYDAPHDVRDKMSKAALTAHQEKYCSQVQVRNVLQRLSQTIAEQVKAA